MLEAGTLLDGRYRLVEEVAQGGMGTVWRAADDSLARVVAIKMLRSEFVADAQSRERLAFEARAVASIDSPNVVRIYDVGNLTHPDARQLPYLVMEYVDGESLSTLLKSQGPWPSQRIAQLLHDVSLGLIAAHREGLVHRDIKPGNILITTTGAAKITDFGIAHGPVSSNLTLTGTLVGTAKYLAPEQVEGRAATSASDVYALGVVAYESAAGYAPFIADTDVATALMRLQSDPAPLPTVTPARLSNLIAMMLSRQPERRPTLEQVISEASMVTHGSTDGTRTLTSSSADFRVVDPTEPRRIRRKSIMIPFVVIACALAGATAFALVGSGGSSRNPPTSTIPTNPHLPVSAMPSAMPIPSARAPAAHTTPATSSSQKLLVSPTSAASVPSTSQFPTTQPATVTKTKGKPTTNPGNGHIKTK